MADVYYFKICLEEMFKALLFRDKWLQILFFKRHDFSDKQIIPI